MRRALIDPRRCQACRPCPAQMACDAQAFFREQPDEPPWIDLYRCRGCLRCLTACPARAITEIVQPCDGHRRPGW